MGSSRAHMMLMRSENGLRQNPIPNNTRPTGPKPVWLPVEPGCYRARLILRSRTCWGNDQVFSEIEHHLIVWPDGRVRETYYIGCTGSMHIFTGRGRVWDPAILKDYQLTRYEETFLSKVRGLRREYNEQPEESIPCEAK